MTRLLFAAACLAFFSAPAAANAPWFDAAVKDWDGNIRSVSDLEDFFFRDEENVNRTLYYRTAQVPESQSKLKVDAPLYILQASPEPTVSAYSLQGKDVKVAHFKNNGVSPYYISHVNGDYFYISRRDRPETNLLVRVYRGKHMDKWWQLSPLFREGTMAKDDSGFRMIVDKPTTEGGASSSPLVVNHVEETACAIIGQDPVEIMSGREGTHPRNKIMNNYIPFEWELSLAAIADFDPSEEGAKSLGSEGKVDKANADIAAKRANAVSASVALAKRLPGESKSLFTREESALITCRLARLRLSGSTLPSTFFTQASSGGEAFVSNWRNFVINELNQYATDVQSAPKLPDIPNFKELDKLLIARITDAVNGKFPPAPAAAKTVATTAKAPDPAPARDAERQRRAKRDKPAKTVEVMD